MGEYFSDLHTKKKQKQYCYFIYTTYRTKKTFTCICVYLSSYIYMDINFEIFLYYYMRIPSPISSHIIAAADAWCVCV